MKKQLHLLSFILFFISINLAAQSPNHQLNLRQVAKVRPLPLGPEGPAPVQAEQSASPRFSGKAVTMGITWNDIQTNGSTNHRLLYTPDGELSAIWHFGIDQANTFPDRGTGYNHYNGTEWGEIPNDRVEGEIRGGYPTFTIDGMGNEYVLSHQNPSGSLWEIGVHKKAAGTDEWTSSTMMTNYGNGLVWAKAAAGGANNQTLHVIAITLATAFGGVEHLGMDQHLMYYRSTDGGDTWDITDMVIPGCDSTAYNEMDAEAYAIDARGDYVAIGVYPFWGDARIFKSEDNGSTWTQHIMHDFPLDKYDETGYTTADIPEDLDAPDSLAIATVDNSATILIDNNNQVHSVVGAMYVIDGNMFFPGTEDLLYWNESFGEDSVSTIAILEDVDDNGMIDLSDTLPDYFMALTSMASMGVDAEDNLYVAYSGMKEDLLNVSQNQNLRHIYMIKSEDGGTTWTAPFNVINEETVDPAAVRFIECVWPAIPKNIKESIPLMYQQDLSPGMSVFGDEDPGQENAMVYFELDKTDFSLLVTTDTEEPVKELLAMELFPNPSQGLTTLQYELPSPAAVRIRVMDSMGRVQQQEWVNQQAAGWQQYLITTDGLVRGIYWVELELDGQRVVKKLCVASE